jgi:hypothetical protein
MRLRLVRLRTCRIHPVPDLSEGYNFAPEVPGVGQGTI